MWKMSTTVNMLLLWVWAHWSRSPLFSVSFSSRNLVRFFYLPGLLCQSTYYLYWLRSQEAWRSTFYSELGRRNEGEVNESGHVAHGVMGEVGVTGRWGFSVLSKAADVALPWNGDDVSWERLLWGAGEVVAELVLVEGPRWPMGKMGK